MFSYDHCLIPVSIIRNVRSSPYGNIYSRTVYVFGIRIFYWTCNP